MTDEPLVEVIETALYPEHWHRTMSGGLAGYAAAAVRAHIAAVLDAEEAKTPHFPNAIANLRATLLGEGR